MNKKHATRSRPCTTCFPEHTCIYSTHELIVGGRWSAYTTHHEPALAWTGVLQLLLYQRPMFRVSYATW